MVSLMNARPWRRMLGRWARAKQQLLPQCQSCFSIQGAAVKAGVHKLVFHSRLRVWHASPAIACLLASQPEVREALNPLVQWVDGFVVKVQRALDLD